MRTQKQNANLKHLSNSITLFKELLAISRGLDQKKIDKLIADRDYEELELLIIHALMGK